MKPEALFPYAYPVSKVTFNDIIHSQGGASPPHSLVLHSHSYHKKNARMCNAYLDIKISHKKTMDKYG